MFSDTINVAATNTATSKRIWIGGEVLARNHFVKGAKYNRVVYDDKLVLKLAKHGSYVVSGKKNKASGYKPLIDIHCREVQSFTGSADNVRVDLEVGIIVISLHHHARKQKLREKSFKEGCNNKSLTKGDL